MLNYHQLLTALKSEDEEIRFLAQQILRHPLNYKYDPVGFCEFVLKVDLTDKQKQIAQAVNDHKRVLVISAHAVGKSFIAACLCWWWYQTRDPSITIITAPTYRQVSDVLFKELRRLDESNRDLMPVQTRCSSSPQHYMNGFTSTGSTNFQGTHGEAVFACFDEATGVPTERWEAVKSCLIGGETRWLAICNPTDLTSQAYAESQTGNWHVISMSAWDHPNIQLELQGKPPLIPSAIRLEELRTDIKEWCQTVHDVPRSTDLHFEGVWYRPGAIAEARLLGRWPSCNSYGIFNEADLTRAEETVVAIHPIADQIIIACDPARYGDDNTAIHVKQGGKSLLHLSYNGMDTKYTSDLLKKLCHEWAPLNTDPKKIAVKIDEGGLGAGVVDQRADYNFIGINFGSRSSNADYTNKRAEMLFGLAKALHEGKVSLRDLTKEQVKEIKRQAMTQKYRIDPMGRLQAESKDDIKARLGRSPDDLDAVALAFSEYGTHYLTNFKAPVLATGRNKSPF